MTHEQPKDKAMPGAHQIPLLSDNAPLRRPKIHKPARAPAKSSNATRIASRDPAYDPDSLDLFQDVFAALTSESRTAALHRGAGEAAREARIRLNS